MSYSSYFIIVFGLALGYGYYFYRRAQVKKAGGDDAYARARLNKLFQLAESERVTAAWAAVKMPKKSTGQKAVEVASAAFAAMSGLGVRYVGTPLVVACTTENRVLILDKKDDVVRAYGPSLRPRFVDTGNEGSKRTSQTQWGWVEGAVVSFRAPGEEPIEIDILAAAVPVLVGWSRGEDVSRLSGPIPRPDTI